MKRFTKILIIIQLLIIGFALMFNKNNISYASGSDGIPYDTLTLGTDNRLVGTKTAYIPYGLLNQKDDIVLKNPKDMYFYNDNLYIADTGNKRVVIVNKDGSFVNEFTHSSFNEITGIFVSDLGIYIADRGAKQVYKFD